MARLRKEKGQSSKRRPDVKRATSKTAKPSKNGALPLGGSHEDTELLKGLDESVVTGSVNKDPTLATDVSQFLKGLSLKPEYDAKGKAKEMPQPPHTTFPKKAGKSEKKDKNPASSAPENKAKGKTKETSQPPNTATLKTSGKGDKKDRNTTPTNAQPDKHNASERVEEPKVVLPTKVSLNPKSHFIFQPTSFWYNALPRLPETSSAVPALTSSQLASLAAKATDLHETDIHTFQTSSNSNSSSSEASFLAKIISSGTLSDRLSALTLLVQSSPLHNIKALETLKTMAERGKGKGGREESLKALRCIVDWWVGGGAPNRKLKYFRDQPLLHPGVTDQYLLVWHYEDWLKKYFFSILQVLETLSLDPLPYVRTQTLTLISTLLRDKPEQEQNLLRLLVNKLGDTEKSLASRASYHILQLLQSHPAMKGIVVREIISLVLRPAAAPALSTPSKMHIRFGDAEPSKPKSKPVLAAEKKTGNSHARYYATVTFNQVVLTPGDREVALQLIDVYFEIFKELLGEGTEEGLVNQEETEVPELKTDKGGRVKEAKVRGKGKGKQTEIKGAAGFTEVEDSSSKLISAILTGVNRALPFAKISASDVGINKHIDTLFLITHQSTFNISLQALVLIQQIAGSISSTPDSQSSSSATVKSITDRYYRTLYASLFDTRLATSSKQAMYLNLFFKSVKADAGKGDGERVKALIRRFVQLLVSGGGGAAEFIAGGLFLLGELFSSVPGLREMITQSPKETDETYDPRKREPQFAHASCLPLWELAPLLNHYHPAVSLHARQLLNSQPLTASADLSQNTLSHFLDRFVYKNPKKVKEGETAGAKGASAMQPAASGLEGVKLMKGEGVSHGMVNDSAFLRKKARDVPVDQLFFHQYFTRKEEKEKAKAAKVGKRKDGKESSDEEEEADGDDDELVTSDREEETEAVADDENEVADEDDEENSDIDEDEVWKVMQASMPKADGDDDLMEDSDADIDDEDDDLSLDMSGEDESDADDDDNGKHVASDDDDDGLSLVEGSDNEDLVSLDGDLPEGLIEYDGSDAEDDDNVNDKEEVWGGISGSTETGSKRKREETKSEKRKKLRSLPTFASYEDYAKMIEDGPEDDI